MSTNENSCRLTNYENSNSWESFNRLACAKCYELLQYVFKDFSSRFEYNMTEDGYLVSNYNYNRTIDLNRDEDVEVLKNSLDNLEFKKWNDCCMAAKKCCSNIMYSPIIGNTKKSF